METPLVSVICLCYNHARFVEDAIQSVINQTYPSIELIVVDDASTDGSPAIIESIISKHSYIKFIKLTTNVGNCAAFNKGFLQSKGDCLIDFAADDILMPNRVEEGINALIKSSDQVGVQFSDAYLIDENDATVGLHSDRHPHVSIPQGDVYLDVISRYFICGPTMMVKRKVLEDLHGYDESLAYEDFDFWIRSSRLYHYQYIPKQLVKRRLVGNSMSSRQFVKGSSQLRSTFKVCKKIFALNRNEAEKKALIKRIHYEIKVCLKLLEWRLAMAYFKLLRRVKS